MGQELNEMYKDYLKDLLGDSYLKHINEEYDNYFDSIGEITDGISLILKTHLFIEYQLEKIILLKLPNGKKLLREGHLTFYQKLILVQSFEVIELQILDVIRKLNEIRNEIAHDITFNINEETIDKLGKPLGKFYSHVIKKKYFSMFDKDIEDYNVSDEIPIKLRILFGYLTSKLNQLVNLTN